ncbi:MAG: carotenoid oxygenase family protein [Leptolyngbyaceae cyanobacterium bins.302]|nr:carotenoid oxygenase family protein [Leptolyngbyaceae cyanobacterium bins.302]
MTTTQKPVQAPSWANAILTPAQEFAPMQLEVLSGAIPSGLQGRLYRNGPAFLSRNGQSVEHWFDGDGGILGVHFRDRHAIATYRYVQTAGWQQEEQAGRYILAGYGMLPPGGWFTRLGKDVKNAANTSVLVLTDKLLALWEGGMPHALNLETLETVGLDDLEGLNGRAFSAHPKRDPVTGAIYNFGISIGTKTRLNVYRCDRTGKLQHHHAIPINGFPVVHDFAIAGRYLIFCIPPVRIQPLPLLARVKSYSDAMAWQPELGTEILILDRDTLNLVSRTPTEAWYQWHFGNGSELPDGTIQIEIARYPDFQTNQRLKEIAFGAIQTPAIATLWLLRLNPQTGKVLSMQQALDRSCEFPVSRPQDVGQPFRYTYLSTHRQSSNTRSEIYDSIACFDHHTATLTEANLDEGCYPNEPIYAPNASNPNHGWILTVLYNSRGDRSELWIFDSDRLSDAPVCRLALPHIIPIGFHGTWQASPD